MTTKNISVIAGVAAGVLATAILINRKREPKTVAGKSRELLNKIESNAKDLKKTAKKMSQKGISQGKSFVDNLATK